VEELLAGAGMNGFLGILDPPASTTHLEKLVGEADTVSTKPRGDSEAPKASGNIEEWNTQAAEVSARVASVVLKVEALTELLNLKATTKNCYGETKMGDVR
jgi:hypothetical protein